MLRESDFRNMELRKDLDAQRDLNLEIQEEKKEAIDELGALKEHCRLLEEQNREVSEEKTHPA